MSRATDKRNVLNKAITIEAILKRYYKNGVKVVHREQEVQEGGVLVEGINIQAPGFMFMLDYPEQEDGFVVSVIGDAPSVSLVLNEIWKKYPTLYHYGPFAVVPGEDGQPKMLQGDEAVAAKPDLICREAFRIIEQSKVENAG